MHVKTPPLISQWKISSASAHHRVEPSCRDISDITPPSRVKFSREAALFPEHFVHLIFENTCTRFTGHKKTVLTFWPAGPN
jgi:hypothetical protein